MKIFTAEFTSSFTASRFADQKRQEGWNVCEENPLNIREKYIIEYWK